MNNTAKSTPSALLALGNIIWNTCFLKESCRATAYTAARVALSVTELSKGNYHSRNRDDNGNDS